MLRQKIFGVVVFAMVLGAAGARGQEIPCTSTNPPHSGVLVGNVCVPFSHLLPVDPPQELDARSSAPFYSGTTLSIQSLQLSNLIIPCGSGQVSISMKTGAATFRDCTPDEAGQKFWDAVSRMFPQAIPH